MILGSINFELNVVVDHSLWFNRQSWALDVLEFSLSGSMFLCFKSVNSLHIQILHAEGGILVNKFL